MWPNKLAVNQCMQIPKALNEYAYLERPRDQPLIRYLIRNTVQQRLWFYKTFLKLLVIPTQKTQFISTYSVILTIGTSRTRVRNQPRQIRWSCWFTNCVGNNRSDARKHLYGQHTLNQSKYFHRVHPEIANKYRDVARFVYRYGQCLKDPKGFSSPI